MKTIIRLVFLCFLCLGVITLTSCSCGAKSTDNSKNPSITKDNPMSADQGTSNITDPAPSTGDNEDYESYSVTLTIKLNNYDFNNYVEDDLNKYANEYEIKNDGSIVYYLEKDISYYIDELDYVLYRYSKELLENIYYIDLDNTPYVATLDIIDDKSNVVLCDSYSGLVKNYTEYFDINFYNDDDSLLCSLRVREGKDAVYPYSNPISSKINEYTDYEFIGWDSYLKEVTCSMDVYAEYRKIVVPHAVNYYDVDGVTLLYHKDATSEIEMKYVGNLPEKASDLENDISYSFSKWEVKYSDDSRIDYIPVFEEYTRGLVFEDHTVIAYVGTKKEIHLPTRANGIVIDTIGPQCFETRDIEKIYLTDSIKTICEKAFFNVTTLTDVVFGKGLTYIETQAFNGCTGLTKIILPSSLTNIGDKAFSSCTSIKEVTIPVGLSFGPSNSISVEYMDIFYNISLDKLYLVKGIGDTLSTAFLRGASVKDIYVMDGIIEIEQGAFAECSNLDTLYVGKDIEKIGNGAARSTSLRELTIVGNNTTIDLLAFCGCTNLSSAVLGNTTSIGSECFEGCKNLSVFQGNHLKTIGNSAFKGCSSLTSFKASDSVTSIGNNAFESCFKLSEVTLGNKLESIGNNAFLNCPSLSIIYIYSDLKTIGSDAFLNCSSLSYIFSVNELKPINYTAGWYGKARPIWGYQRTAIDDNYIYYYAVEYDYKKVYMLNSDLSPISENNNLGRFIDEYEIILLENPTKTHINDIVREKDPSPTPSSASSSSNMSAINYSNLFVELSSSILPIYRSYVGSTYSWQCQYKYCFLAGHGSYYLLSLSISNNVYTSADYAALVNKQSGWNLVWMNNHYLAYYQDTDFYMEFKDEDNKLQIDIYGEYVEMDEGNASGNNPGNNEGGGEEPPTETPGEEESQVDLINYELSSDGTYYIAKSLKNHSFNSLVIPSTYNNLPVKEIADNFSRGLYTNTYSLVIPSSIKTIGINAFYGNKISTLTLSEGLETIGEYAFGNLLGNLSSIDIPSTVNKMGANPFVFCQNLRDITFTNGSDYFTVSDKVLFTKDMKTMICFIPKKAGSYTIPSTVETIGKSAISDIRTNHSITIPKSVKKIETMAFASNTSISSISYQGTMNEFEAIYLEEDWNWNCYIQYVVCSDGSVKIRAD